MKTRILQTAAYLFICYSALCLTACQNPSGGTSSTLTIGNVVSDLTLAGSVAAQYEAIAKKRKVTVADYAIIAKSAADQYAAANPGATAAQIDSWVSSAVSLVAIYDSVHGVK